MYLWDNPSGNREIIWSCGNIQNQVIKSDRCVNNSDFFLWQYNHLINVLIRNPISNMKYLIMKKFTV